ncbi:MAG: hypothetical protein AAB795_03330 [Patescibacteria group bacterium]
MVYLLFGENSYRAFQKIADIKSAFYKKGGKNLAVVEMSGYDASMEEILESIGAGNLFATRRLIVLKRAIETHPRLINFIEENKKELMAPNDVFIFWERNFSNNNKALLLFKKIAEKIEETNIRSFNELDLWFRKEADAREIQTSSQQRKTMIEKQSILYGEASEWALLQELEKITLGGEKNAGTNQKQIQTTNNLIFSFVDRIFGNKFSRALIVFRQSKQEGIGEADLFRMFLWKLKNIFIVKNGETKKLNSYVAQKTSVDAVQFDDKNILDAFWEGILTDSALKRDNKNTDEHIESYILSMKNPK